MKIFITGAGGFIGGHLLEHLHAAGHSVTGSARSTQAKTKLSTLGIKVVYGDLYRDVDLKRALAGHDAVIHCAAYVRLWGPARLFEEANVGLTQKLLEATKLAGVKRFVHMSTANVVMNQNQELQDAQESADLCARPEMPYARSKAKAEKIVLAANAKGFSTVILRPALVWGQGDVIDTLIGPASHQGKFGWFSQGRYLYSTCYIGNLCEATSLVLHSPAASEVFFIADDEVMEYRDFMEQRLAVGHYQIPRLSIPRSIAWPLARFTESGWNYLPLRGEPPLVREAVRTMGYPFTVSIKKAQKILIYKAPFQIKQGMDAIQRSLKEVKE